jgi:recombination protein RecT
MNNQNKLIEFKNQLAGKMKQGIGNILPSSVDRNRFEMTCFYHIAQNPMLLDPKYNRQSLFLSLYTLAQWGLAPESHLGEAYLIPFKGRIIPMIGYKGFLRLARNTGLVASIYARCVYTKDQFEIEYGFEQKIVHRPNFDDPGEFRGVYAVCKLKDGSDPIFVYLTKADVIKRRDTSSGYRNSKDSPWNSHFEAMAEKTAIRALAKWIPLDTLHKAAAVDESNEEGRSVYLDDGMVMDADYAIEKETPKEEKVKDAIRQAEYEQQVDEEIKKIYEFLADNKKIADFAQKEEKEPFEFIDSSIVAYFQNDIDIEKLKDKKFPQTLMQYIETKQTHKRQ